MARTVAFYKMTCTACRQIRLHPHTCKSMELGKSRAFTEYKMMSSDGLVTLVQVVSEKNLGVILDPSMTFREDISSKVNKAIG